jgi:oligoendopeptidase F
LSAALNGIKGEANTLQGRRAWPDPLDEAVFNANIDRDTLDALIGAAREAFPDLRRYLRRKAGLLGQAHLAWYDLFAPVGDAGRSWAWPAAVAFLEEQFGAYSDRLRVLMTRAAEERWIDAGPRPGKTDGAFCMHLRGDESRILHNFTPSYDGVTTLAHEMGHAYHNLNEAGLTPLQRQTPMTLAETASTFCETIVKEAVLTGASRPEQLFIVEQSLQGATQVIIDIVSRFDFERSVFAKRRELELSSAEFSALMLDAQRATYGDGLDDGLRHPFMWAAKGHYYIEGLSFYNFPYLFGLLFGLGLYARYREDPAGFRAGYDDLLAHTGRADAATLAAGWGIDLRDPAFWRSSLDVVRADVARFEELAGEG